MVSTPKEKLKNFFTVEDKWTSPDKFAHFLLLGLAPSYIVGFQTGDVWKGLGAGLFVGLFKEIVDLFSNGTASYKDLLATWAGAAAGVGVTYLLTLVGS